MIFPPPVAEVLGLELLSSGEGEAVMALDAEERHGNPMSFLQGEAPTGRLTRGSKR